MDPIIYILPKIDTLPPLNITHSDQPNPKLLKYGFNSITENLDIETITTVPQYKSGLGFDFESEDIPGAKVKLSKLFNVNVDLNFAEFWEIIYLFKLLDTNQTIYTNYPKVVKDNIKAYKHLSDKSHKYDVEDKIGKSKYSLIMYKYSDSNVDIDENVGIQLLADNLADLLNAQAKDGTMVLQLHGLQTQVNAELIYYLSSLYVDAYLMKPNVTSDLSNSVYIILVGLKQPVKSPPFNKSKKPYLSSIGLGHVPVETDNVIQCINSTVIPLRYNTYNKIKSYLRTKVYEGSTYQNMISTQYTNVDKWINMYGDIGKADGVLDAALKKSGNKCVAYDKLSSLLK